MFLLNTLWNLMSGNGTGWTTQEEVDELKQAMIEAGKIGYAEGSADAWNKHLKAWQHPQPQEWSE